MPRKRSPRCWSDEIVAFVRKHSPNHSRAELTKLINDEFGTDFKESAVKSFCLRMRIPGKCARFTKGHRPWNKDMKGLAIGGKETQFQKGSIPHNHRPVGSERIAKGGFIEIKIAEPNKWRPKHHVIYEQAHGAIPKGYVVRFVDNNQLNLSPSNLIAITKQANALLNCRYSSLKHLLGHGNNLTVINIAQLQALINRKSK